MMCSISLVETVETVGVVLHTQPRPCCHGNCVDTQRTSQGVVRRLQPLVAANSWRKQGRYLIQRVLRSLSITIAITKAADLVHVDPNAYDVLATSMQELLYTNRQKWGHSYL